MKSIRQQVVLVISGLVAALALTACGGGGGGGSSASSTSGAAVSKGVITAKGSVFVNGIEYSTAGAVIKVDDNPGVENDLKVGMIVKVRGTSDDLTKKGTATQIEARDALEGKIDSIDAPNKTITVMGQVVQIEDNVTRLNDDDTVKVFSGANFQLNDHVEVHAVPDDKGGLRATRVAKKLTGEFESKGFVTALGANSFGLSLAPNGASVLTVNFATGALPAGTANGSLVEVKSAVAPIAGAITASLIKLEDRLGAAGEKVEVEGIVMSGGTLASFMINGQQVLTDAATVFEGGLSSDFAVGVKLEAEGPLNANGAIVATKISFRSNIKLEGDVTAFTAGSNLTVLGYAIAINPATTRIDGTIANGTHVEVRAMKDRDGNLLATRIVAQSASPRAFLQAPVSLANSAAGTMTILNTPVTSNGQTQWRISSTSSEQPVTAAQFFAQLKLNVSIVKVRWDALPITAPIKEAEIELGK